MNAKTRTILIASFVVVILLFLLFTAVLIIGSLSDAGMMGNGMMTGMTWYSWMWIPTVLTLGLIFLIGWAVFSKNVKE